MDAKEAKIETMLRTSEAVDQIKQKLKLIWEWVSKEHERREQNAAPGPGMSERPLPGRDLRKYRARLASYEQEIEALAKDATDPRWESGDPERLGFLKDLCKDRLQMTLAFPECVLVDPGDAYDGELTASHIIRHTIHTSIEDGAVFYRYMTKEMPEAKGRYRAMVDPAIEALCEDLFTSVNALAKAFLYRLEYMVNFYG